MNRWLPSVALLCLFPLLGIAQNPREFTIWGRVIFPDSTRPAELEVRLEMAGHVYVNSTTTDAEGRFQFRNLNEGNFFLQINLEGYRPITEEVRIRVPSAQPTLSTLGDTTDPRVILFLQKGSNDFVLPRTERNATETRPGPVVSTVVNAELLKRFNARAVREFSDGKSAAEKEDFAKALGHFRKAVDSEPRFMEARIEFGRTMQRIGRLPEAEAEFKRARDMAPDAPLPLVRLGGLLLEKARALEQAGKSPEAFRTYDEAADLLDAALRMDLDQSEAHYLLGSALFKLNELEGAESNLLQAIGARRPMPEARLILTNVYVKSRRYRDALDQLDAYISEYPDSPQRKSIEQTQAQIRSLLKP